MNVKIEKKITGITTKKKPENRTAVLKERPKVVSGKTYKLKPPTLEHAMYMTVNDLDGKPFEIFLQTKDPQHLQWTAALTRMMSAVFRRSDDINFIIEELCCVYDPNGGFFDGPSYTPSLVALIGKTLKEHIGSVEETKIKPTGVQCPKCLNFTLIKQAGCEECTDCGYSKCS